MFISVIPCVKMPYGNSFFDYKITEGTAHVGDLIMVPFRKKMVPALISKVATTSAYEDKTISLSEVKKIIKFPDILPEICLKSAQQSLVSPATMLNAWLRNVPKRLPDLDPHVLRRNSHRPKDKPRSQEFYLTNRYLGEQGLIQTAQNEQANGRVLIITPWQSRVDFLRHKLGCPGLTSKTADGAAWKIWNDFMANPHGVLITTRLGAWLCSCADIVIMDEPENDDYKQDELTPRYDARRIVEITEQENPALRVIKIGTTPSLKTLKNGQLPASQTLEPEIKIEAFASAGRSSISSLTAATHEEIQAAVLRGQKIRILHAVGGSRGRVRCADCDWILTCDRCGTGMNNYSQYAQCKKCSAKTQLPTSCPICQGSNFSKAMIGCDEMQKQVQRDFPEADIKILDLSNWSTAPTPTKSLLIITELAFIGGWTEDIRKKERLVIAFRRIAAQATNTQSRLIIQGNDILLNQCLNWLTPAGLLNAWKQEWQDRDSFEFPPAHQLVKLIVINNQTDLTDIIKQKLNQPDWKINGPWPVENMTKTRDSRLIYHILPPDNLSQEQVAEQVTCLIKLGIIDLDPIAFFW